MEVPGERMTEESYATLGWNQPPVKFKAERRFRGRCIVSREGFFLVLTGMPRPVPGESYTTSIKDFAIFPPHQKKNNNMIYTLPLHNFIHKICLMHKSRKMEEQSYSNIVFYLGSLTILSVKKQYFIPLDITIY